MKLFTAITGFVCLFFSTTYAQINFTANTPGKVPLYNGQFLYGSNMGSYPTWNDKTLADIAAGNPAKNVPGAGVKTLRPLLTDALFQQYGYTIRISEFQHYASLGIKDITTFIGDPSENHRDKNKYDGCGQESRLFANMYEPIWDGGANGTPINDNNYYAAFVYGTVTNYKQWTKFWEIENEPDFDNGGNGWKSPGQAGNWWDNNPKPCDLPNMKAPIFHYIRMLRISYEVIKSVDPAAFVCTGGIGYPSFLDAILRNSDNPDGGTVNNAYPNKGGAYFDCLSFHEYPQHALAYWDNSLGRRVQTRHSDAAMAQMIKKKDAMLNVLSTYGYSSNLPAKVFICTEGNIPRMKIPGGTHIGTEEAQKNFIIKTLIACQKNEVKQFYTYALGDGTNPSGDYNQQMGLYKTLSDIGSYNQQLNAEGVAYKTTSDILLEHRYDAGKTAAMRLPANDIDGAAFKNSAGKYVYVLWAKTKTDESENASATYSFPAAMGVSAQMEKRAWDYSKTKSSSNIASQNVPLSGSPVFFLDGNLAPPSQPPTITSFSPANGAIGTSITITGTNFASNPGDNVVKINGAIATVTAASATNLTIIVPQGAGTGKITVTVGTQTATSATDFRVNNTPNPIPANQLPEITGFSPMDGEVGTAVTITGTNFNTTANQNSIKFNGITSSVIAASNTQLTTTVPAGAATGKITVTTSGGTATSAADFTVIVNLPPPNTPAPVIASFTPASGQTGTVVSIIGSNFNRASNANLVKFNGITATVTTASTTELSVIVPPEATTGKITVTTSAGTATGAIDFVVSVVLATEMELKEKFGFQLAPNPTEGQTTLTFELAKNENVSLGIFDSKGKRIKSLMDNKMQSPNKYEIPLNTQQLSGGLYFCKLSIGQAVLVGKLVVVK
jgi:hypothetical protein